MLFNLDRLITAFDNGLRTLAVPPISARPTPDAVVEGELTDNERRAAAALMRVNHTGEVCAQALYQGQALTARNPAARAALEQAAAEETDHLAWTSQRISELGGRTSLLNPFWYLGSLAMGAVAGALGDRWNLGFLAETERQVEAHLGEHLQKLPEADAASRAVVAQMQADEARHGQLAREAGGIDLPPPVPDLMRLASAIMKAVAYRV